MTTSAEDGRLAALLEAMLASSLDAVVTIDASARVLMFNRAAEETFGYREADALGRDIADLIVPEHLRERHRAGLARHLADGTRVIMDRRVELTGLRSDGSEFPVELTVTRVPLDGPPVFTAYRGTSRIRSAPRRSSGPRARASSSRPTASAAGSSATSTTARSNGSSRSACSCTRSRGPSSTAPRESSSR
jgi:PAS domain S-box-containing protein